MRRALAFRRLAAIALVSYVFGFAIVGVSLALAGAGIWALVAAQLSQVTLACCLQLHCRSHAKKFCIRPRALRDLMVFGGGLTAWQISAALALSADNMVVGRWLGAAALGLYGRAYQLISMPVAVIGKTIGSVAFPMLSRVQDRPQQLRDGYSRSTALLSLVALPAAAAGSLLGPEIVDVVLGQAWSGAVVPLQILAPGVFFRLSFRISELLAQATGAVYAIAWRQMTFAGLVIGGAMIGQTWGLSGVATGVLGAQAVQFLLLAWLGTRISGLSKRAYMVLHAGGAMLAIIVAGELAFIVHVLRRANIGSLTILLVALFVAGTTAAAVILLRGGVLAGREAQWLLRRLGERVPNRLSILRRLLPPTAVSGLDTLGCPDNLQVHDSALTKSAVSRGAPAPR